MNVPRLSQHRRKVQQGVNTSRSDVKLGLSAVINDAEQDEELIPGAYLGGPLQLGPLWR